MYAEERQQAMAQLISRRGRLSVVQLAGEFEVTTETVRRDLTALEQRGSVRRVHGGAIPVERLELEPSLATRSTRHAGVKRRIAARVLDELTALAGRIGVGRVADLTGAVRPPVGR